jgi:hypothetical protein
MIVPTLVDVQRGTLRYSVFFLRAATDRPAVFFDSCIDSGYSIDNYAPAEPHNFVNVGRAPDGALNLDWDANTESDLHHYSLFRSSEPDFVPSEENRLVDLSEDQYADHTVPTGDLRLCYKLGAADVAGNTSDYAVASTGGIVGLVPRGGHPAAFALHPAVPNPMRGRSRIPFDLPISSIVRLQIFDSRGRLIRVLGDRVPLDAGRYEWEWGGADSNGSPVPVGVYFYRLDSPRFSKSRSAVVVEGGR